MKPRKMTIEKVKMALKFGDRYWNILIAQIGVKVLDNDCQVQILLIKYNIETKVL